MLATQHVGGWIVSPLKDGDGNVTATNLKYVNSSDAGGNIPKFIQTREGPKTAIAPIVGTIDWIRNNMKCKR